MSSQDTKKHYGRKNDPGSFNYRTALLVACGILLLAVIVKFAFLPKAGDPELDAGKESQAVEQRMEAETPEVTEPETTEPAVTEPETMEPETVEPETMEPVTPESENAEQEIQVPQEVLPFSEPVYWDDGWLFAENSLVHQESVNLYHADPANRKGYIIAINAGHGSNSAAKVSTLCHPDGTPKVTGGSTGAGAITATGANGGMTFLDGTPESIVNLDLALTVKEHLLAAGYDVLMLREDVDCDLDNIARSLYANNYANCHIALHYDSTENDKGLFYIGVPDNKSYRSMEPVASLWPEHEALGDALLAGAEIMDVKIHNEGRMALDLTQTSYSTVPSVDLEVGDRKSDHSRETHDVLAEAICIGLDIFFESR